MQVSTQAKRQVIDITNDIASVVNGTGIVFVFVAHTTAAVTTADLDPGTDEDFLEFLQRITPKAQWRHPHDPNHVPDHLLASMIGSNIVVPVKDGELQLGTWQRIVLVEFDGPRERNVTVQLIKET